MAEPHRSNHTLADRSWPHLRGHVLSFGPKARPDHPASAGLWMLLIAILLEGVIGPRFWIAGLLGLPTPPAWARVPALLGLAWVLLRFVARLSPQQLGLRAWRNWSTAEKSYFVQVCLIANIVFAALFATPLKTIVAEPSRWGGAIAMALVYLGWGFYQELVYRGVLQAELTRRWGGAAGILVSNLLYTFGPLHLYHLSGPAPAPMFAAIFAIGLFFSLLFARSGNLWMVGVFHGIGDAYMSGLGSPVR